MPGTRRVSGLVPRKNSVNNLAWSSCEMPNPSSVHSSTTRSRRRPTETATLPPAGVNFTALLTRFCTTRSRSPALPRTGGTPVLQVEGQPDLLVVGARSEHVDHVARHLAQVDVGLGHGPVGVADPRRA